MAKEFKEYKIEKSQIEFSGWIIEGSSGRILASISDEREKFQSQLNLPNLPEMIFADNILSLSRIDSNFKLSFNALDALSLVGNKDDIIKVASAKAWAEARSDCEHIKNIVDLFDWTFSTDYSGTLLGNHRLEPTNQKLDIEKLMSKDRILYYTSLILYEDELHDFGTSSISVKIRVMLDYFLILLRFFLRVDDVIFRINDTRYYFQSGSKHLLKELTKREGYCDKIKIPPGISHDPDSLSKFLPLIKEETYIIHLTG